jgi:hypothetical protein
MPSGFRPALRPVAALLAGAAGMINFPALHAFTLIKAAARLAANTLHKKFLHDQPTR